MSGLISCRLIERWAKETFLRLNRAVYFRGKAMTRPPSLNVLTPPTDHHHVSFHSYPVQMTKSCGCVSVAMCVNADWMRL